MTNHKLHGGAHSSAPGVTSERPSCKCEKALPGGCEVGGGGGLSPAGGAACLVLRTQGPSWPGRLAPLPLALAHVGSRVLTGG